MATSRRNPMHHFSQPKKLLGPGKSHGVLCGASPGYYGGSSDNAGNGGESSDPVFETITTQATNTPTDNTTNVYEVPAWANSVAIMPGRLPNARFRLDVYVNDGVSTIRVECYSWQKQILEVAGGTTLYFGSHERTESGIATSSVSTSITVAPIAMPVALSAPSGATGTANVDLSSPAHWTPSAAHITLPDYGLEFQINSTAAYQDFFMSEKDSAGTWGPIQWIRVNANESEIIRCVGREIALMSILETSASITAPTGTTIGGTQDRYRPSYTVTGTSRSVSASSDGFGGDQGTAGENLAYCLKNITSGDEIVLAAGTYDMSGSGNPINPTNYATAMGRDCRIRGTTGTATDVIITGSAIYVFQQNTTTKWVFESLTMGVTGYAPHSAGRAVVDLNMNTSLYNVLVSGPGLAVGTPGSEYPLIEWRGNSTLATTPVAAWCYFSESLDDLVEANTHANMTLSLIGCTLDSNGANAITNNYQVLTSHNGATCEAWGCIFTDVTTSANDIQVWGDTSSFIHLFFCRSLAANLVGTNGITLYRINTMYGCIFDKCRQFNLESRISAWIGNRLTKDSVSVSACVQLATDTVAYSLLAGNYMKCSNTSTTNANGVDARRSVELLGNIVECVAASSSVPLRIAPTGAPGSAAPNVIAANNRFIAANALFEIGTATTLGVELYSNLFTGSATNVSVGASGSSCIAEDNYFERSGTPTNWVTRFTTDSGNTFSATDVTYDADGWANNVSAGHEIGRFGGIDSRGRALWNGSPYTRGPVEKQSIKVGIVLYPSTRAA